MPYEITVEKTAKKQIRKLQPSEQVRIAEAILTLADDPRPAGCLKLTNREAWRIRVGDYRIIYEIRDEVLIVVVVTVGHRREVYKK